MFHNKQNDFPHIKTFTVKNIPASPTIPIAKPEASPQIPTESPAAKSQNDMKRVYFGAGYTVCRELRKVSNRIRFI